MKKKLIFILVFSTITLAQVPGTFSLSSPANGVYANATPNFTWNTSSGANYYQLYVDGVLKKDNIVTSYYQVLSNEALTEGLHTWYVKAVNGSGTKQSNETWSVRIDATQPTAFNLISPSDNSWTNNLQPTFEWSASSDAASGLVKYQLWIDNNLIQDNISSNSTSTLPPTWYQLSNGNHTWYIKSIDNAGNERNSSQTNVIKFDNLPPGQKNKSIYFNGINSSVTIPSNSALDLNYNLTLEAWIKFYEGGTDNPRIISRDNGNNTGYELFTNGTGDQRTITFSIGGVGSITSSSNNKLYANQWYHIAAIISGNYYSCEMSLYINGSENTYISYSNKSIIPTSTPFGVGRRLSNGRDNFYGYIDEIRIWNINRTQQQIFDSKDISLNGNEPGLVGYWSFNEGNGNITLDNTSNGNNGTLLNGAIFSDSSPEGTNLGRLCTIKTPVYGTFLTNVNPLFSWGKAPDSGIGFQKFQLWIDNNLNKDNLVDSVCSTTTPLSYGQHTWFIKGFDLLGNNQLSPIGTFYIDNQPPNAFNLLNPSDSSVVNLPTPNLSWEATTDYTGGSGLSKYQLWLNNVKNIDSISTTSTTTSPNQALSEGSYNWYIKAYDKVGNVRQSTQTRTFFVDFNPPL